MTDPQDLRAKLTEHVERDQADHAVLVAVFEEYLVETNPADADDIRALLKGHISATDASHERLLHAVDTHIERVSE